MNITDDTLAKVLTDLKYLPEDKLEKAANDASVDDASLYDTLIHHDYVSEDELGKVVAYHFQLPYISLGKINIPAELLQVLPERIAKEYQTLPYKFEYGVLHIASAQPEQQDLFDMIAKKVGATSSKLSFATENGVNAALHLFKRELQQEVDGFLARSQADTPPVAQLVDLILTYAMDAQASDVHIEPLREQSIVRFRVDGVLHDEAYFPKKIHDQIVTRLKVMARLRTDEHLSAQDGRMRVTIRGKELAVRISAVPLITGEKVAMRLLSRHTRQFNLTNLGMSKAAMDLVREGFNRPFGMVLSTGPTGSGKTTTIYAILKLLNTRDRNIATIEDPVEYELGGTNQVQTNAKTNLTFSEGLRSLLRQDPDVLFVGEIRDAETASIAVNAAMTGHLVLSTMHTNDAATTLPRLVDMGIEPYLVGSTVNIIIGQRLVRQICSHCKASIKLTHTPKGWQGDQSYAMLLNQIGEPTIARHFGNHAEIRIYHGVGCTACHETGYQGRIGIFEVLKITPKLAQLIAAKADSDKLTDQAVHDGMVTMLEDGLDKVAAGDTTLTEIIRVTKG